MKILRQGGVIRWPDQRPQLPLIVRMFLDASTFIGISGGDLPSLAIGNLAAYGDLAVQRKIQSRLNNPSQFEDLMLELSVAAWHHFEGHHITPSEAEGWSDLRIDITTLDIPLLLECKRLATATSNRIRKDITKANRQIKSVGIQAYGVAVLDVSYALPQEPKPVIDEIPTQVETILKAVRAALLGPKHRSVGRAIVVWDDAGIEGEPPARTTVVLRRRFAYVDHGPDPSVRILPPTAPTFHGSTVLYDIGWDTSSRDIDRLADSDLMKECRTWFGFTDAELIDAYRDHQKWEPVDISEGARFFLFTYPSYHLDKPTLLLALASRNSSTLALQFALRLPTRYLELTDLLTPYEILQQVTQDYGLNVTIGGRTARLVRQHSFELSPQAGPVEFLNVFNPNNHSVLCCMIYKMVPTGATLVAQCALVFAVDRTRLTADLLGASSGFMGAG